jgi:hypothetical protein
MLHAEQLKRRRRNNMSPKEMIEAQSLEFDKLADVAQRHFAMANEPHKDRMIVSLVAKWHKGSADTYKFCAEKLRDLLKLKGWEPNDAESQLTDLRETLRLANAQAADFKARADELESQARLNHFTDFAPSSPNFRKGNNLSHKTCDTMPPRLRDIVGDDERIDNGAFLGECERPVYHKGPHQFTTPDGVRYGWEDDACNCEDCMSDDSADRCFLFWEIKPSSTQLQEKTNKEVKI